MRRHGLSPLEVAAHLRLRGLWACALLGSSALIASCANPTSDCECSGAVPGGELAVACGETQCVGGRTYECVGPNEAVDRGSCSGPPRNPRPADAPDVVLVTVSGHCFTTCADGRNPEYLITERQTYLPITNLLESQGISWAAYGYTDNFYNIVDTATGELLDAGFLQLLADLEIIRDQWIGDFDNPTHVMVLGHSHGTVWAHLALLVLEWWGVPIPVDILIDLDGNSLSWEDDTFTFFVGDNWGDVIRAYNRETGMTWPFAIDNAADLWLVAGVADAQDTEDLVPNSVIANIEVFSNGDPYDPDPNHRRDGSRTNLVSFGPTSTHNGVTEPTSEAMRWVTENIRAAYGW